MSSAQRWSELPERSSKRRVTPVVELLPPPSDRGQVFVVPPRLQFCCQSVDGGDVSIIHRHLLQVDTCKRVVGDAEPDEAIAITSERLSPCRRNF